MKKRALSWQKEVKQIEDRYYRQIERNDTFYKTMGLLREMDEERTDYLKKYVKKYAKNRQEVSFITCAYLDSVVQRESEKKRTVMEAGEKVSGSRKSSRRQSL